MLSTASAVQYLDGACITGNAAVPERGFFPPSEDDANDGSSAEQRGSETNVATASYRAQGTFGVRDPSPSFPVFTSREEEIEFASQPVEEIVAAEADVLGLTEDMARVDVGEDLGASLVELEDELALLPIYRKAAYVEATQRCPELVDAEHKKAFLWREEYNAKLAAKRLVAYWEHRRALFGEECWCLPLTIAGALKHDAAALQTCLICLLPVKDERGRVVIDLVWRRYDPTSEAISAESMMRACWYTFHVATRDPTVRERGFVLLVRPEAEDDGEYVRRFFWTYAKFVRSFIALEVEVLPIVFRGFHWCKPQVIFHLVAPMIKYVLGKRLRGRFKVHYGPNEDVLKSLKEYGLTRKCLPKKLGGDDVGCHYQWLSDRLAEECLTSSVSAAAVLGLAKSSSPVNIEGNDQVWEPTPMRDGHEGTLTAAVHSDQEATSRLEELESASSVRRRLDRSAHEDTSSHEDRKKSDMAKEMPQRSVDKEEKATEPDVVHAEDCSKNVKKFGRGRGGRIGDPRMNKAVNAKLNDPDLSLVEALLQGGFVFPEMDEPYVTNHTLFDTDNVTMHQRKNQLLRRLRYVKKQ